MNEVFDTLFAFDPWYCNILSFPIFRYNHNRITTFENASIDLSDSILIICSIGIKNKIYRKKLEDYLE